MGSRSHSVLRHCLLFLPYVALLGVVLLLFLGYRVTAVLRQPASYDFAGSIVQTLTRAVYWRTRTHWQMVRECAQFDVELLYRPRPGSCEFRNAEFSTTMRFDDRGARWTPEPSITDGTGQLPRIIVLGDSYAMGWGVDDDQTFASVLTSRFGYPTVNLGVSSYATPRELRRLERDFELRDDDIIVIQYSENDLEENRAFAGVRRTGPYEPGELEAMQTYRPTPVATVPVAGLILRIAAHDLIARAAAIFRRTGAPAGGQLDHTEAFLAVLDTHSQWRKHRTFIVPINRPGQNIPLAESRLRAAGVELIVPRLQSGDFFSIDDHLRPRGHDAVAAAIADRLGEPDAD